MRPTLYSVLGAAYNTATIRQNQRYYTPYHSFTLLTPNQFRGWISHNTRKKWKTALTNNISNEAYGTTRQELVKQCAAGDFILAIGTLENASLDVVTSISLWEYLERQLANANELGLAEFSRKRLSKMGSYSTRMALADAESALEQGQSHKAQLILSSTFTPHNLPPSVERLMASALSKDRNSFDKAIDLFSKLADTDADAALAEIDLLRSDDQLLHAETRCKAYHEQYSQDHRFAVRLARIKGALNNWSEATALWETLSNWPGYRRSNALANMILLKARQGEHESIAPLMTELLVASPDITELLTVTEALGLFDVSKAMLNKALSEHRRSPLPERSWAAVAQTSLQSGQIGRVAWMVNQGLPIGKQSTEVLAAAQRVLGQLPDTINSPSQAAALNSPDCLLPYPSYLRTRRPPLKLNKEDARILLVNASLVSGGAERQFVALAKALLAQGIKPEQMDIALFSLSPDRGRSHFLPELASLGVNIHDLRTITSKYDGMEPELEDRCQLLPNPMRLDVTSLHHIIRRVRPNIIHGWQDRASLAAGFIGAFTGIERIIMSARNMQPSKRDPGARVDNRSQYAALCALPHVTMSANSQAGCTDYENWLGLREGTIKLLNNGLDVASIRSEGFNKYGKRMPTGSEITVSGVFRLTPNKRPFLWLETIAALKKISDYNIQPRIVGVGPLKPEVIDYAQHLGLDNFHLAGDLLRPQDIYRDADIVLLMSRIEGTPNVLLEAQTLGIPVAACDVGGVRNAMTLHGDAAGLLLSEDIKPMAAAQKLNSWLPRALEADPEPRREFINREFSIDSLGVKTLELYGIS